MKAEITPDMEITLAFTNYYVEGQAVLNLWGGGRGSIEMEPFYVDKLPESLKELPFNDGSFGCESIDSVRITVYANYEGCRVPHIEDKVLNLSKCVRSCTDKDEEEEE